MAKNSEATLWIKIKETGAEALGKINDGFSAMKVQIAAAAAALVAFIAYSVKAYGEAERASNELTQAIKNQGLDVNKLKEQYDKLASAIQKKSLYDDDEVTAAIAIGQQYAGNIELSKELVEATVDYAAATGTDLKSAFEKVGKSIGTTTNALKREGIALDENATATEKMDIVTGSLIDRFDGMAEAQAKGVGSVTKLKNAFGGLIETVGKFFAPFVEGAATKLISWIDKIQGKLSAFVDGKAEVAKVETDEAIAYQAKAEEKAMADSIERKKKLIAKSRAVQIVAKEKEAAEDAEKEDEKIQDNLDRLQGWFDQWNEAEARQREKLTEDEKKAYEKTLEERRKVIEESNGQIAAFLQGGFQSIAQKGVESLTNTFLPGFGGAAGQAFQILSQNTEEFEKTLEKLFSVEFVENIAKNIDKLAEKMPEIIQRLEDQMPEVVARLVASLIENGPKIAMAISQAFSDPNLYKEMALSIRDTFKNGIKDGWDEAWEYLKDRLKIKIEMPGGGGGGGGGVIGGIADEVSSWFAKGGVVKPIYAAGGMMIPRGTDTVPAMLTPGEFVVNRNAAQANMGTLQSINSGGSGGGGQTIINLTVQGGLLGDAQSARQLATALDRELLRLRQQNSSVSFDKGVF